MLVTPTDHDDVFAFQSEVPRVNIGREKLGEGSEVRAVVDVWPSGADNASSQFFHPFQKEMRLLPSWLDKGLQNRFLETVEIPGRAYCGEGHRIGQL